MLLPPEVSRSDETPVQSQYAGHKLLALIFGYHDVDNAVNDGVVTNVSLNSTSYSCGFDRNAGKRYGFYAA